MITKDNFKELILKLGFSAEGDKFLKKFKETDAYLKVDFKTDSFNVPFELEPFVIKSSLVHLINFVRPDFNKGIATSPKRVIEIETKWDSRKIGDIDSLILKKGSYRYFKEGDIIIAKITPCMENGKCAIANELTNKVGFGSSEFHVFRVNEDLTTNKFLFTFLNREVIRKEAEKNMTGSSGHRRVPDTFYKNLQIPAPTDLKVQAKLISNIEKAETKIKASQELIAGIAKRKEAVIRSYLMGEATEPELAMAAELKMKYKKKKS